MNSRSIILSVLIASACSLHLADDGALKDILEALSDDYNKGGTQKGEGAYDVSWERANLLSAIDKSPENASTGLARYWSGSTAFVTSDDKISDIQKAQIFIDLTVAKPYVKFDELQTSIDGFSQSMIANNIVGSVSPQTNMVLGVWKSMLNSDPDKKLMEIYYRLYVLEKKAINCLSYWDGGSVTSNLPTYVIAPNNAVAMLFLNSAVPECNKMSCSTEDSQYDFNKQSKLIAKEANNIYKKIKDLKCDDLADDTEKNLCRRVQSDGKDILEDAHKDISEATIDGLSNITTLSQTTQAILLLRFSAKLKLIELALPGLSEGEISFSSIYTPKPILSSDDKNPGTDGKANYRDTKEGVSPRLNTLVDSLAGLSGIASPIRPGLPVLDLFTLITPQIMVAGEYYKFVPDGGLYRSSERKNGNYIWTTADTISDAQKMRSDMRSNFYIKRGGVQAAATQSILAKSAAADILNEVKGLNTNIHQYSDGTRQTGMQTLKQSSNWRLEGTKIDDKGSWLHNVASMSNVSLLRETAVLLAEMKQLMYMQLSNQQKSLLIQALIASSGTPEAALDTVELEAAIENYAGGSGLSSKTPPSPPSVDDINNQVKVAQNNV